MVPIEKGWSKPHGLPPALFLNATFHLQSCVSVEFFLVFEGKVRLFLRLLAGGNTTILRGVLEGYGAKRAESAGLVRCGYDPT